MYRFQQGEPMAALTESLMEHIVRFQYNLRHCYFFKLSNPWKTQASVNRSYYLLSEAEQVIHRKSIISYFWTWCQQEQKLTVTLMSKYFVFQSLVSIVSKIHAGLAEQIGNVKENCFIFGKMAMFLP